jgi:hypothetical protein
MFKRTKGITTKNPLVGDEMWNDPLTYIQPMRTGTMRTMINAVQECS